MVGIGMKVGEWNRRLKEKEDEQLRPLQELMAWKTSTYFVDRLLSSDDRSHYDARPEFLFACGLLVPADLFPFHILEAFYMHQVSISQDAHTTRHEVQRRLQDK